MSYQPSYRRSATRPTSLYSSPSSILGGYGGGLSQSSPYLSSGSSSPSYTSYGGTSSGYGGLLLPSSSSTSLHSLSSSPSLYTSLLGALGPSSRSSSPGYTRPSYSPTLRSPSTSRLPSRTSSFNRHLTRTRPSDTFLTGSSKSLASEGYESGGEQSEASSRLNSVSCEDENKEETTENGEIDYKKLYEQSLIVNDRLREKLRTTEEELIEVKAQAEKSAAVIRNSLSESEKRERRAMERKLSEMEEELKQLQKLKSDNERLRAENRALTRVVSKLTASHTK